MEWPTTDQCYSAMETLAEYYMEGEKLELWRDLIHRGLAEGIFPPGKGFLVDLYEAMTRSEKPELESYRDLHQLICTVCV